MKKKGFTLIELMIVLAVLAIIMGFVFKAYTQQIKKSNNISKQNDVEYHTKNAVNRIVHEVEKYKTEIQLKDSQSIYRGNSIKLIYFNSTEKSLYLLTDKIFEGIKSVQFSYSDPISKSTLNISITGEIDGYSYKLDTGVSLK